MAEGRGDLNVPNALSVARLGMVVPLGALLWLGDAPGYGWADTAALAVFALAFATDLVDGWLARRWAQVTEVGQHLDPLADKALIACALVFLTGRGLAPAWAVVAILVREFAVTGLRSMAGSRDLHIPASKAAKTKTLFQSLAVLLFLLPPGLGVAGVGTAVLGLWVLYVAVVLTLYSGALYYYGFFRKAPAASGSGSPPATTGTMR